MISDWSFYAAAVPAVFLLGLGKGGFSGVGLLSIPLMALVVSPVQAPRSCSRSSWCRTW
jgi:hypothetical protein